MENSRRIILDTNIIVSAACFGRGAPYEVLNIVGQHHILLFSIDTYTELEEVILRDKFDKYALVTERRQMLKKVRDISEIIEVTATVNDIPHDYADNHLLSLAIDGKADYLVTGNTRHFMAEQIREKYGELIICTAREFLQEAEDTLINRYT